MSTNAKGVTLIELVVTIAVLAILLALALPSFADFLAKSRLKGAGDDLADQIALARSEAIRLDRNVILSVASDSATKQWCSGARQFDLASGSTLGITMVSGNPLPCNCLTADAANCLVAGNQSLITSDALADVEMTSGNGVTLTFDRKLGTLTRLDLTVPQRSIELRSKSRPSRFKINIVVSPLGHANICVPSGYPTFGGYDQCA